MSHRRCCRRESRCGFGTGFGNWWIWIVIAVLICNCRVDCGGRRRC